MFRVEARLCLSTGFFLMNGTCRGLRVRAGTNRRAYKTKLHRGSLYPVLMSAQQRRVLAAIDKPTRAINLWSSGGWLGDTGKVINGQNLQEEKKKKKGVQGGEQAEAGRQHVASRAGGNTQAYSSHLDLSCHPSASRWSHRRTLGKVSNLQSASW